jgi:hypothetical protein
VLVAPIEARKRLAGRCRNNAVPWQSCKELIPRLLNNNYVSRHLRKRKNKPRRPTEKYRCQYDILLSVSLQGSGRERGMRLTILFISNKAKSPLLFLSRTDLGCGSASVIARMTPFLCAYGRIL